MAYATKAKVEHAVRMAKSAGIEIGALELSPDGVIRITAANRNEKSAEFEIAEWRTRRGKAK